MQTTQLDQRHRACTSPCVHVSRSYMGLPACAARSQMEGVSRVPRHASAIGHVMLKQAPRSELWWISCRRRMRRSTGTLSSARCAAGGSAPWWKLCKTSYCSKLNEAHACDDRADRRRRHARRERSARRGAARSGHAADTQRARSGHAADTQWVRSGHAAGARRRHVARHGHAVTLLGMQ